MRHPQALALLVIVVGLAFVLLMQADLLWGALGALICGLVVMYVIALAWVRAPRSGARTGQASSDDSFSDLP